MRIDGSPHTLDLLGINCLRFLDDKHGNKSHMEDEISSTVSFEALLSRHAWNE